MRIFLSYAREQVSLAERIHQTLTNDGHRVFFDRTSLPAGEAFDAAIRHEIAASDLFVFVASTASLDRNSYAWTELKVAEATWPRPSGSVLPVLADPDLVAQLPAHLRSVHAVREGDLVASTGAEVAKLAGKRRRRRLRAIAAAVVGLVAIAAVVPWPDALARVDGLAIASGVTWRSRGALGSGDVFEVQVDLHNEADVEAILSGIDVEFEAERLQFVRLERELHWPTTTTIPAHEHRTVVWRGRVTLPDELRLLPADELAGARWRLAWQRRGSGQSTPFVAWHPDGSPAPSPVRQVDAPWTAQARLLAPTASGFVVVAVDPPRLVWLTAECTAQRESALPAVPTCIAVDGDDVWLGEVAAGRGQVRHLAGDGTVQVEALPATRLDDGEADLATRPVSIAVARGVVWVSADGDGAGAALLVRRDGSWRLHPAVAKQTVPCEAWRLRVLPGPADEPPSVWGVPETVPVHLVRFVDDVGAEVDGHDDRFAFASSAQDIAPGAAPGTLSLCDGDNQLVLAQWSADGLRELRHVPSPIPAETELGTTFQEERLLRCSGDLIAFHWTRGVRDVGWNLLDFRIARFAAAANAGQLLFARPFVELVDAAANLDRVLFLVRDEHELVRAATLDR